MHARSVAGLAIRANSIAAFMILAACLGMALGCSDPAVDSSTPCDMTSQCGMWQVCVGGTCREQPACPACIDGEVCVGGLCLPPSCGDRPCRAGEGCLNDRCVAADCVTVQCPANEACAQGSCHPVDCSAQRCDEGVCWGGACVSARCVGVLCGADQTCVQGACVPTGCVGVLCSAQAACVGGRCQEVACAGVHCSSGTLCSGGRCVAVGCADGRVCLEGQVCRDGACVDPGCVEAACGEGHHCAASACLACSAAETHCSDGRDEDCDGLVDCADPDCAALACDDRDPCTSGDSCQDELCAGAPLECRSPPNQHCYEEAGSCEGGACRYIQKPAGAACDAGNLCLLGQRCDGMGMCTGSSWRECEDEDPCTADFCNPSSGCMHAIATNWTACGLEQACYWGECISAPPCDLDGVLYEPGAGNPDNVCEWCSPLRHLEPRVYGPRPPEALRESSDSGEAAAESGARALSSWSSRPDGTTCGDERVCVWGICERYCRINDEYLPEGEEHWDGCRYCQPETSKTEWTYLPDGTECSGGKRVCVDGWCNNGCWIGGVHYPASTINPANECQHCVPGTDLNAWSNRADGAIVCGPDADGLCQEGECIVVPPN